MDPLDPSQFEEIEKPSAPLQASPSQQVVSQEQPAPQPQMPPPQQQQQQQQVAPHALPTPQQVQAQASPQASPTARGPQELNPAQFEEAPAGLGQTPFAPLNQSPLSIEERFKLGVSNDAGKIDFLKQRFAGVVKDPHTGNFIVKDQGQWHLVDGKAFGDVDTWTATKSIAKGAAALGAIGPLGLMMSDDLQRGDAGAQGIVRAAKSLGWLTLGQQDKAIKEASSNPVSKEIMSEYAENAPVLAAAGVAALAAPFAAGIGAGAGLGALGIGAMEATGVGLAAGAMEGLRTSLGRFEGTYKASTTEQIVDVAKESLFNMAGTAFTLGIKPTAGAVADMLPGVANAFKRGGDASVDLLKKTYGALAGISEESFDALVQHAPQVAGMMKAAGSAGRSTAAYVDQIASRQIDMVKDMAELAPKLLTETYQKLSNSIASQVPEAFKADIQNVTSKVIQQGLDAGQLAIQTPKGKLNAVEAAQLMAENGGKLPAWAKPVMVPLADMQKAMQQSGKISNTALDPEAYASMKKFYDRVALLHPTENLQGRQGFEQMMSLSKSLDDTTRQIGQTAKNEGQAEVYRMMSAMHEQTVRPSILDSLKPHGLDQAFSSMQATYSSMKNELLPFLNANKSSLTRGDAAFESLKTKLMSAPGKGVTAKEGINNALAIAEKFGSDHAATARTIQQGVRVAQAAQEFHPLIKPNFVSGGAMTAAVGGAMTGHPVLAAMAGAGAMATSPRLAMYNTQVLNGMWKFKNTIVGLSPSAKNAFLNNPAAVGGATRIILATPFMQEQVKNQALQSVGLSPSNSGGIR